MSTARKYQTAKLHSQRATSRAGSKSTRVATEYLSPLLPTGWERSFEIRRAGKYWGLSVVCPVCGERPPVELAYGIRRWRWMTVHVARHRPIAVVK